MPIKCWDCKKEPQRKDDIWINDYLCPYCFSKMFDQLKQKYIEKAHLWGHPFKE